MVDGQFHFDARYGHVSHDAGTGYVERVFVCLPLFVGKVPAVAEELNDRPRKTLGYMKPSEKILELLDAAS